jgi:hypothetical protein
MPGVKYTPDGLPYFDATDQQTQPYFPQANGPMLPAPGIPGSMPEAWNAGVRGLAGSLMDTLAAPGRAMQGQYAVQPSVPGLWSEEDEFRRQQAMGQQVASATDLGMGLVGSPMTPQGALGSSLRAPGVGPEKIVSATYKVGDQVFQAPNHFDAAEMAVKGLGLKNMNELMRLGGRVDAEGFMTSAGRVVSREEANRIAQAAEQGATKNFLGKIRAEEINLPIPKAQAPQFQ